MFYQVTIYDSQGVIKQVIPPEALSSHHWGKFQKLDYSRKTRGFTIGRVAAEMNRELQRFLKVERVYDEFTYHYGV